MKKLKTDSSRDAKEIQSALKTVSVRVNGLDKDSREKLSTLKRQIDEKKNETEQISGRGVGDPLELQKLVEDIKELRGDDGLLRQSAVEAKTDLANRVKPLGVGLSQAKLQYDNPRDLDLNRFGREKDEFIEQQKRDLKTRLELEKAILEKSRGLQTQGVVPNISDPVLTEEGTIEREYSDETQRLIGLDPGNFTTPDVTRNVEDISFDQTELRNIFREEVGTRRRTNIE